MAYMSDSVRTLQEIHASFSPALPGRIIAAVLLSVFFGATVSPLAGPWILFILAPVLLVGMFYVSISLRATGLRANNYAPMRADDETPSSLGGTMEEPRSPNRRLQVFTYVAGPAIYLLIWAGQYINSATAQWTYAGIVTALTLVAFWRAFVLEGAVPDGYLPPSHVFAAEPDWSPHDDADAVAAVLHAVQAVPGGRQVRRDVLTGLARPLTSSPQDASGVDRGLQALTAQGRSAVLRERKDATTVVEWVTLTTDGRDHYETSPPMAGR